MFEKLFEDPFWHTMSDFGRWRPLSRFFEEEVRVRQPLVNLWGGEDELFLTAEVPGFNPEEMDLSIQGNAINLKGEKKIPEPKEGESFLRRERSFGKFNRTLELPFQIDAERVRADFQNGILLVRMARSETDKPKKISIQTSE